MVYMGAVMSIIYALSLVLLSATVVGAVDAVATQRPTTRLIRG